MKPASAKARGRKFQQEIAKLIVESFEELGVDDAVSRPTGSPGVDIMLSNLAQKVFPVSIECKNTKAQPGKAALEQAAYNTYLDTVPVVCWRPPRAQPENYVSYMKTVDVIRLIKLVRENG